MTHNVVNNVTNLLAICSHIIETSQSTIVWLAPQSVMTLFVRYGMLESAKAFMERGGSMRGITYVANPRDKTARELARAGADIRHMHHNPREFMLIGDGGENISSVNIEPEYLSFESSIVAFWTSDPNYAHWLLSTFETEWALSAKS